MIYLIDDKKERQNSLGWDYEKLNKYCDILKPIYLYKEIEEDRKNIFSKDNIVFYHESFFDNPKNVHHKNTLEINKDLKQYSEDNNTIVVFFSGSIGSRNVTNNTASIPVSVLYNNLVFFLDTYNANKNDININQIVFGKEYLKENLLILKKEIWDLLYEKNNNDLFINNSTINLKLIEINKITGIQLNITNVTNGFFKYQLNNIR